MSDSDAELFRHAVEGATKLSIEPRVERRHPRSALFQPACSAAPSMAVAPLSDDFEPAVLASIDESIFHRPQIARRTVRKLWRGAWRIEAQLDLHHMCRFEARDALYNFLQQAVQRGHRCVRVIHGKGWGSPNGQSILKEKVRFWLAQIEDVIAFCSARPQEGGTGAVMVLLRSSAARRSAR